MSILKVNDIFKCKTIENNSNCSGYHGGPHGVIRDMNTKEAYKVKAIHYGGIYDGKNHVGTIETYCNCFIRYYPDIIVKIEH